jgi:3-mercaptopropionate dioxygenase
MTTSTLNRATGELVDAIRAALVQPGDWAAAAASVGDAVHANLPAASALDGAAHPLHVEPDGSFSVLALTWRPDQWTRIHDHVTWCVFATVQGDPVEELFALRDDALVPAGRRPCPAGTISGDAPPGDIHRLGNPGAEPAITLHVYGTDVSRIGTSVRRIYDLPIVEGSGTRRA